MPNASQKLKLENKSSKNLFQTCKIIFIVKSSINKGDFKLEISSMTLKVLLTMSSKNNVTIK
jgi:hypothetical protein